MSTEAVDHEELVRDAVLAVARCANTHAAAISDLNPFIAQCLDRVAHHLTECAASCGHGE